MEMVWTRTQLVVMVWMMLGVAAPTLAYADSAERLAEELVVLRGEVERLNTTLDQAKTDHRTEMRILQAQRAELQAEAQREQLKIEKLKAHLGKQRELARKAGIDQQELKPVVHRALNELDTLIRQALPFKTAERLAEVETLRTQVQTDVLTPQKAVSRLWGLYEDEIRLAGENGVDRQPIVVNGEERLADVARLGMVMLYVRTSEDEYGRAVRDGEGWRYDMYSRGGDRERVAALFESFDRQIRTGYFEVPNAMTVTESPVGSP